MKTLFENKYTCTEDVYMDIYKHIYLHNKLYIGIAIFYVFIFAFTTIISLMNGLGINLASVVALIFLYAITYIFYRRAAKRRYKEDLATNRQTAVVSTFTVRDDYIAVKHANSTIMKVQYDDIKRVSNSKNYILLTTTSKVALAFKKDSFVIGTADNFEKFLREKGFKFR